MTRSEPLPGSSQARGPHRWNPFESPQSFARVCVRVAVALGIIGITGLVDPWSVLPFAGFLLAFAALAWLVGSDVLDDPPDPSDELAIDPVASPPVAEAR